MVPSRLPWCSAAMLLVLVAACGTKTGPRPAMTPVTDTVRMRSLLALMASDSVQGRFTGTAEAGLVAQAIADELAEMGLEPAGDSGYFQRVPIQVTQRSDGRPRYTFYPSIRALRLLPPEQQLVALNVVARLPGVDTTSSQVVIVGAHYDHLGVRRPIGGDSIYNGADDASGAVGALEVAHNLVQGPGLKRSVVFLFTAGEAIGFLGARLYAEYPVAPFLETVGALWLENIGRPDPLLGPGTAWLTGSDRTDLGRLLDDAGLNLDLEPDPRPEQQIYLRTESVVLAQRGVPAHTLSSFGFHADWHQPSDEIETIDFAHMAQVVETATEVVRYLATGTPPQFYRGAQPRRTDF